MRRYLIILLFCCIAGASIRAQSTQAGSNGTYIVSAQSELLKLESAESVALSESDLTRTQNRGLNLNPALDHTDAKQPANLMLVFTPGVQGLSDAYNAAVEGGYYAAPIGLSLTAGAARNAYSSIYSDVDALIGIAKVFDLADNRHVAVGARYRYKSVSYTAPYPPVKFNILDLGFTFDATSEFSIGGAAINLLGSGQITGGGSAGDLEKTFLVGATYHPTDTPVALHTSIEEDGSSPVALHIGAEYLPVESFVLRAGTSTDTGDITAGAGLSYEQYGLDLAATFDHNFGTMITFGLSGKW